jgi:hypothetical protein
MADLSELLTVSEAATVAGVSVRTMRRWAAGGQVRTVGKGHGRKVVAASLSELSASTVTIGQDDRPEVTAETARSATAATETANGHEADRLADLVRELSQRLAEQTAMTALWMERARVLSDQLALPAPEASQTTTAGQETAPVSESTTEAPAHWWRSWVVYGVGGLVVIVIAAAAWLVPR